MEILAVIEGLKALKFPCAVTVYSDSKYVVDAMEQGWAKRWQKSWVKFIPPAGRPTNHTRCVCTLDIGPVAYPCRSQFFGVLSHTHKGRLHFCVCTVLVLFLASFPLGFSCSGLPIYCTLGSVIQSSQMAVCGKSLNLPRSEYTSPTCCRNLD